MQRQSYAWHISSACPRHIAEIKTLPHLRDPFGDYLPCLLLARTRETKPPALLLGSMAQQTDEMIKLWGTISSVEELRCLSPHKGKISTL